MQPDPRVGHRLVWTRGTAFASSMLPASDPVAVVGRHTQCDVVLGDDPFVALRHILVRSIALPSGGLALRVFDLHTNLGFVLPDGSRHAAIFAEGPVALGLGEYALVALPNENKDDALPAALPEPVVETPPDAREQLQALAHAMAPYRMNARPAKHTTRITLMPRPVMVGEPLPQSLGRLVGGRWAITLARGQRHATVTVTEDDLVRGVIIGRSEKCYSEELRRITDVSTSRTHILLLRESGATYAYDLASTQGTYANGTKVRRVELHDESAMLVLGQGEAAVRMFWHRA
ncbi:MAG TPA: FHA domain-containing protein [Labilithrix sp.]